MTTSHHQHHGHKHSDHAGSPAPTGSKKHVKWISILALAAMLIALLIYVMTDDESLVPGQPEQQPVPAAP